MPQTDTPEARIAAALETYQRASMLRGATMCAPYSHQDMLLATDAAYEVAHDVAEAVTAAWPDVLARLTAADAFVDAYTMRQQPWVLESSREAIITERAMEEAVAAYQAARGDQP